MTLRTILVVMFGWTALATASAAGHGQQARTTDAPAPSVTLRGCVAESMGHYLLNNATVVDPKATPVPPPSADPSAVKTADVQPYELIGGQAKAHVGHQVEIVGTVRPNEQGAAVRGTAEPTPPAHPMAGRVTIKAIKMLATTCP